MGLIVALIIVTVLAAAGIIGTGVMFWLHLQSKKDGKRIENAKEEAQAINNQAEDEKRRVLLAAQEEVLKVRAAGEQDIKEQRQELNRTERRYQQREEQLDHKTESLEKQQGALTIRETEVQQVWDDWALDVFVRKENIQMKSVPPKAVDDPSR